MAAAAAATSTTTMTDVRIVLYDEKGDEMETDDDIVVRVQTNAVVEASHDASIFDLEDVWAQQGDRSESGQVVWNASALLASMILRERRCVGVETNRDESCIELGAGAGITGIALARLFSRVTLTDLPSCVAALENHIALNGDAITAAGCDQMDAMSLDWCSPPAEHLRESYDVAVAADCVYEGAGVASALLRSAAALLKPSRGWLALLSGIHRDGVGHLEQLVTMSGDWDVPVVRFVDAHGVEARRDECDYVFLCVRKR